MSSILTDMRQSRGAPRDLTSEQVAKLRAQLNNSLYLFARAIMGFDLLEPKFHGELCAYIEAWGSAPDYRRIITQNPRGSFKTSLGTLANALWQICRAPDQPVCILNETENNTSNWLRALRAVVHGSELFHLVYQDILPKGVASSDRRNKSQSLRWNDTQLDFEGRRPSDPEASISAYGMGSAVVGHHWPKIIMDDIISHKHRDSAAEMQRVRDWALTHTELMRPVQAGWAYVNCTPWTFDDVYVDFTQRYGYALYRRAALENADGQPDYNGSPVLSFYDPAELRRSAERDMASFSSQMMCSPLPGGEVTLRPEWVRWFDVDWDAEGRGVLHIEEGSYRSGDAPQRMPLYKLRKELLFDPAPSEPSEVKRGPRSRNGIVVLGVDEFDRRFVLESVALGSTAPQHVIDRLFQLAHRWDAGVVHIEEVNFSKLYRHWILERQQLGGRWAGVRLVPRPIKVRNVEKIKRILDLAPALSGGQIYFNRDGTSDLHAEYLAWHPSAEQQDCVDALAHHRVVQRPLGEAQVARNRQMEYRARSEADITGYGPTCRSE